MKKIAIGALLLSTVEQIQAGNAYPIVGTGQVRCYDTHREINPPAPGQPFYGQDAQYPGRAASYTASADGLTVQDTVTGLIWQRSPDWHGNGTPRSSDKLTYDQAQSLPGKLNAVRYGGFTDWRLPTIKELYSLILFSGVDVSSPDMQNAAQTVPFLDARCFRFAYGDVHANERILDSQWLSSTVSVANRRQVFGVNFADGRIKGYGMSGPGRPDKTFFVICVRGNPAYGKNDFHDNGDNTISDNATGLMWSKYDSGKGMDWKTALAWVQQKNAEKYLGHNDWRLPNAKELQSIVDYSRSPATSHSAAIDPLFHSTAIVNENGEADYPFYWSGTTHVGQRGGMDAVYLAFGRAAGWMSPHGRAMGGPANGPMPPPFGGGEQGGPMRSAPSGDYHYVDVHGAGAQRSDPKEGAATNFPRGRGPQGDVVRIYNDVRLVRFSPT